MCKLKVTRNPLGCSAGLPVPPSQILPPMSWTTLHRGNCYSRLDSGCGSCLNTRGKTGDLEFTQYNPVISWSFHKDDVSQRGRVGARTYMPGLRTCTLLWDAWLRVPTVSLFIGLFSTWSLLFPPSLSQQVWDAFTLVSKFH